MVSIREFSSNSRIKIILKWTISGYLLGVVITILWYLNLAQNPNISRNFSVWIFTILSFFSILMLCYSRHLRCTIALSIPIICSSKGRSLVVAFAFYMAATGPTKNIVKNIDVLSTSISCGQTELKEALEKMLDVMKRPLVAIKDTIGVTIREIRQIMMKVEFILLRIKELVLVLLAGIKNGFNWLGSIVSICNKEFGTPFQRCMHIADNAMNDCREKLGLIKGICRVTHLFSMLCYTVKFFDVICVLVDFFDDNIIQTVLHGLNQFSTEVRNMFDVSVSFDHDFYFRTVASKDFNEVSKTVINDLQYKMRNLYLVFGWIDIVGSVMFLTVLIKAMYFKSKYLGNLEYGNKYITNEFHKIDTERRKKNQELALPLTAAELKIYVQLNSWTLTRPELLKVGRSMLFLFITCVQVFSICLLDYCLYWLLAIISYHGHKEAGLEVPFVTVNIHGGGFVGEIFQGILQAFQPLSRNYTIDISPCLPAPSQPNFERYFQLGGICLLAWILLICQPYGLRLRHVVMRLYYPEIARERAIWLYQDILMKRVTFFKIARRKVRRTFCKNTQRNDSNLLDWIRARTARLFYQYKSSLLSVLYYWHCRVWIVRLIFGHRKSKYCIICSTLVIKDAAVTCGEVGCNAVYCKNCYEESNNNCCVCKSPIACGDFSDISLEKDSSDNLEEVRVDNRNLQYNSSI